MTSAFRTLIATAAMVTASYAAAEEISLADGTTCTLTEEHSGSDGMSTTVTAGNGKVTSSTTSGIGSTSSSSASTSSAGSGSVDSYSSASVTRPDGTVITKRSDGTCSITKPSK